MEAESRHCRGWSVGTFARPQTHRVGTSVGATGFSGVSGRPEIFVQSRGQGLRSGAGDQRADRHQDR